MNERIRKIRKSLKKNFDENAELYFMYGVGMIAGAVTLAVVRKVPATPSFATQFNKWLLDMERQGLAVYAFTPFERRVWEQAWAAVTGGVAGETATAVSANIAVSPENLKKITEAVAELI